MNKHTHTFIYVYLKIYVTFMLLHSAQSNIHKALSCCLEVLHVILNEFTVSLHVWIINGLVLRKPKEKCTWICKKLELGPCCGSSLMIQNGWFQFPFFPFTRQNPINSFLSRSQLLLGLCPSHNPCPVIGVFWKI